MLETLILIWVQTKVLKVWFSESITPLMSYRQHPKENSRPLNDNDKLPDCVRIS